MSGAPGYVHISQRHRLGGAQSTARPRGAHRMVGTAEDFRHLRSVAAEHGADSRLERQPGAGQQPTEARGFVIYVGVDEQAAADRGINLVQLVQDVRQFISSAVPESDSYAAVALAPVHAEGTDLEVVRSALGDPTFSDPVGIALAYPRPLVVPILRAGLGMLEGMTRLIPTAEVGFLGMARDDTTLDIITYAERLPDDLTGRQVYVLDPMLATGGTLSEAIKFLYRRGAEQITCVCLLAAPEGLDRLTRELDDSEVNVVLASVDERLDENAYIVPGLGDAGDRLYGVAH